MTEPLDIDLWLWPLRPVAAPSSALLSADERARADRFHSEALRDAFILCRSRLRRVLARYVGAPAAALPLDIEPGGKPMLAPPAPPLAFNLSHTADLAALAVCPAAPSLRLGVDIEAIRPVREDVATLAFSAAEQRALAAIQAPAAREAAFFAGWTRKEAYLKALGAGLLAPLDQFDVELTPEAARPAIVTRDPTEASAGWRLLSFVPRADVAGALAIDAGERPIRLNRRTIRPLGAPPDRAFQAPS